MISPQPLGDQAALVYLPDEAAAWRFAAAARAAATRCAGTPRGWLDVVQAYASVAVWYDPGRTTFAAVAAALRDLDHAADRSPAAEPYRVELPCCYELQ